MPPTTDPASTAPPRAVAVDCPAKINLHLRVGPVREDGFHPLLSWMATVGLFDRLELRRRQPDGGPAVRLTCEPATLPCDERNLVVRMLVGWAAYLADRGESLPPIDAMLLKRTPTGAGLGGGSSDAACALLAASRFAARDGARQASEASPDERHAEELSAFAARFGSDIPFFLRAPSAVCAGRGEIVRPVAPPAARWAVLLLPPVHMPTPDVYRKFDAMRLGRADDVEREPDWNAWGRLSAAELMEQVVNDLEPPAFAIRPELDGLRQSAEAAIGRPVRMSGSGSSLFTLFDDQPTAEAAKEDVARSLKQRLEAEAVKVVRVGVPIDVVELTD